MIYERLTIPVLPRLKVTIRIVSGAQFTSSIYSASEITYIVSGVALTQLTHSLPDIYGLDWVSKVGPMSNSGVVFVVLLLLQSFPLQPR